ncbi:hypothetical protein V8E36_004488 [Tilletia maclaganii]
MTLDPPTAASSGPGATGDGRPSGRGGGGRGRGRGGPYRGRGGGAGAGSHARHEEVVDPDTQLSKTLSYLLRHGAQAESLPISSAGWVELRAVLERPKIGKLRFGPGAEAGETRTGARVADVRRVVKGSSKKRFQLGWGRPSDSGTSGTGVEVLELEVEGDDAADADADADAGSEELERASDGKKLFIRAVQGHSIKEVSSELLHPITLSNLHLLHPSQPLPSSSSSDSQEAAAAPVPEFDPATLTIVHGTTYPAWERILASGGLNRMGRNQIHLARGLPDGMKAQLPLPAPNFDSSTAAANSTGAANAASTSPETTTTPKIISGMRLNATVLIWVDVQSALRDGVDFFLSENGVVLTPGAVLDPKAAVAVAAAASDNATTSTAGGRSSGGGAHSHGRRGAASKHLGPVPDGWLSLRYVTRVEARGAVGRKAGAAEGGSGDGGSGANGTLAEAATSSEWETIWVRERDWSEKEEAAAPPAA